MPVRRAIKAMPAAIAAHAGVQPWQMFPIRCIERRKKMIKLFCDVIWLLMVIFVLNIVRHMI
jgi:hypothetical protein